MTEAVKMLMLKHSGRSPVMGPELERRAYLEEERLEAEKLLANAEHEKFVRDFVSPTADTARDDEILRICREHFDAAPRDEVVREELPRWTRWKDAMRAEIHRFKTCREALHYAQSAIPFDHRQALVDPLVEISQYVTTIYYEFPWFEDELNLAEENPESIPQTLVLRNGKIASNILYWHLRPLLFCMTMIKDKPNSVLEIGGGYGGLARLWLKNKICEVDRYAIVDLPESLFFAETALRREFGDGVVGYMNGTDDPGTKVVLVPTGNLRNYTRQTDLVLNVGSMQEMEEGWIEFYMAWLDRFAPRYFYSLNYMGQPLGLMAESRNWWAPRPSEQWKATVINPDPVFIKMTCVGRCFADVLYERGGEKVSFSNWSVLHGSILTRATYLEGLELLRQDNSLINRNTFCFTYFQTGTEIGRLPPKEMMWLAQKFGPPDFVAQLGKCVDRFSA